MNENLSEMMKRLTKRRINLHNYIIMKLDDFDYHAVADAAMDLRELEVEIKCQEKVEKLKKQG